MYGNAQQTYAERQKVGINIGEEFFEKWCGRNRWNCFRLGFDEKGANVPAFFNLNIMIRNMPDYVIEREGKTFVVNVKGTPRLKEMERAILPDLIKAYSAPAAKLLYAFCTRHDGMPDGRQIKFAHAEQVIELYDQEFDQQWHDGKTYRTLNLDYLR